MTEAKQLENLEATRQYYDEFADRYDRQRGGRVPGGYHDLIDELEMGFLQPYAEGREVLEVGCGTGLLLSTISSFASRAVGVDLSPGMLEHARARNLDVKETIEGRWRTQFDIQTCAEIVEQRHPAPAACDGHRILVVDDEVEIADAVAAMLVAEGYQVRIAHDGEEALIAVEEFDPQLMIVDY